MQQVKVFPVMSKQSPTSDISGCLLKVQETGNPQGAALLPLPARCFSSSLSLRQRPTPSSLRPNHFVAAPPRNPRAAPQKRKRWRGPTASAPCCLAAPLRSSSPSGVRYVPDEERGVGGPRVAGHGTGAPAVSPHRREGGQAEAPGEQRDALSSAGGGAAAPEGAGIKKPQP